MWWVVWMKVVWIMVRWLGEVVWWVKLILIGRLQCQVFLILKMIQAYACTVSTRNAPDFWSVLHNEILQTLSGRLLVLSAELLSSPEPQN